MVCAMDERHRRRRAEEHSEGCGFGSREKGLKKKDDIFVWVFRVK
jgi:hypothetical protein